jgi:hypothetical protein
MKKVTLLLLATSTISLTSFAQPSKWFVSAVTGIPFGGPVGSLKKHFRRDGLNHTESFQVLFIGGSTKYPIGTRNPPLLVKFGKRLNERRSLYIVAGVSSSGEAEGYKRYDEESALFPLFYSTTGSYVTVKYRLLQVAAGYQYHYANKRLKLAAAPSLFIYKYQNTRAIRKQQHAAVVPGMAFSGRLPLGKEKKLFGVDLIADLNLAPPVKMKELRTENHNSGETVATVLKSGSVNITHGMVGLAFSFRR